MATTDGGGNGGDGGGGDEGGDEGGRSGEAGDEVSRSVPSPVTQQGPIGRRSMQPYEQNR